ncbi:MAG: DUF5916 domain-containing protein [Chitinophagaceae bacterium]
MGRLYFLGYGSKGNDFYEPRLTGYSFRTPRRIQTAFGFETNEAKKYSVGLEYFTGLRSLFNSPNHNISFSHTYRFSDKFSISQRISYNPAKNDAGFYNLYYLSDATGNLIYDANGNKIFSDILFQDVILKQLIMYYPPNIILIINQGLPSGQGITRVR